MRPYGTRLRENRNAAVLSPRRTRSLSAGAFGWFPLRPSHAAGAADRRGAVPAFVPYVWGIAAGLALTVFPEGISVRASETGMITSLSEKVYESMDTEGSVVANVIMGSPFTLLDAQYDGDGNVWYRIRTDMGTEGYLPARNVVRGGQDDPGGQAPEGGPGNASEGNPPGEDQGTGRDDGTETTTAPQVADGTGAAGEGGAEPPEGRPDGTTQADGAQNRPDGTGRETGEDENRTEPGAGAGTDGLLAAGAGNLPAGSGPGGLGTDTTGAEGRPAEVERQAKTIEAVNIRREPSTDAEILGTIPPDITLDCIGIEANRIGETWYEVDYDGVRGYIRESTVEVTELPRTQDPPESPELPAEPPLEKESTPGREGEQKEPESGRTEDTLDSPSAEDGRKEKISAGFYVDWVAVCAFLGCLVCAAVIRCLLKRIVRIDRGKDRKERKKECSPKKRKRHI